MKPSARQDLAHCLPEDLLCVNRRAEAGIPIDAISCAIDRANAVLALLEDQFDNDGPRLNNQTIAAALWDVRGTLGLIRTLAIYGDDTTHRSVKGERQ